MNELFLDNTVLPTVCALDSRAAPEPFYHADRVLDFHVLIYVSEGSIYVTEDGTDYTVGEGSLLFLKSGLRHYGKQETPKGTRWIFFHFYLSESTQPELVPDISDIGVYEPLQSRIMLPKQLSGLKGTLPERRLTELIEYSRSNAPDKRFRLNLMLSRTLADIAFFASSEPTLADRIEAFLERHISEPFSSQALEREFYLSYKRLAAVFARDKGISMQQAHRRMQLAEAARLLRTTDLPVGEIAALCGIPDPLYFSRCFSKEYSSSPRDYRRKMSGSY
ncbi:MAG: helix-turn-helix transcriptional regulator [Ruminococcus sp.]|nr:helix-turn-helix transcriptional regulator [Ruminococcus sp.]